MAKKKYGKHNGYDIDQQLEGYAKFAQMQDDKGARQKSKIIQSMRRAAYTQKDINEAFSSANKTQASFKKQDDQRVYNEQKSKERQQKLAREAALNRQARLASIPGTPMPQVPIYNSRPIEDHVDEEEPEYVRRGTFALGYNPFRII